MRTTRVFIGSIAAGLLLLGSLPASAPATAEPSANGHRGVTVMTRNLYVGGEIDQLLTAQSFPEVVWKVTQIWAAVQATDFELRAEGIADEIEDALPDLIGLQEAALWRIQEEGDMLYGGTTPATDVAYDFVGILLDELSSRGIHYEVAVSQDRMDVELPTIYGEDVRLTDRDVILVRRHGNAPGRGPVKITATSGADFQVLLQVPVGGPGGPVVSIDRGWVAVDAKMHGESFRFINAHLEDDIVPPVQVAQAYELIAGPLDVDGRVILLGDFNSDALGGSTATATYGILLNSGLVDSWTASGGATWGHDPDLLNATPNLTQRLDFVFHDGSFVVEDTDVVGDEVADITPSGLWPSDHAGVVASFTFVRP